MPTPIAHSLIGVSVYLGSGKRFSKCWRSLTGGLLFCLVYTNLPDIDFLPGIIVGDLNKFHHGITHSLAFVVIVSLITAVIARFIFKKSFWRMGVFSLILLALHLIMDFFTGDTSLPRGVPLFWPFSNEYFISPFSIFPAFPKRGSVLDIINPLNITAYRYELLVCLPVFILALFIKIKGALQRGATKNSMKET